MLGTPLWPVARPLVLPQFCVGVPQPLHLELLALAFSMMQPEGDATSPALLHTSSPPGSLGMFQRMRGSPERPRLSTRSERRQVRVYQNWETFGGKSRFRCFGWCVRGPSIDRKYAVSAWLFVLVPPSVHLIVCAEYLWHYQSAVLPVAVLVLLVSSSVLVTLTSCTDPGIIPRRTLQLAVPGLEAEVAKVTGVPVLRVHPVTKEPVVDLSREMEAEGYRWCTTCRVVRPPRTSHCKDCDNCVLRMDHHCPFVCNCIGQRNYAYFLAMLASVVCLGVTVTFNTALYTSAAANNHPGTRLRDHALYVLLALVGAPTEVMLLCVTGLALFHATLICRGRTTREALRDRSGVRTATLFSPRGQSLIRARSVLEQPVASGAFPSTGGVSLRENDVTSHSSVDMS